MTYINDTSTLDGYETPIEINTLSPAVLGGFNQTPLRAGGLMRFNFNTSWTNDNSYSPAMQYGNFGPMIIPGGVLFSPGNLNIDFPTTGGGGGGSAYTCLALSGVANGFLALSSGTCTATGGTEYEITTGADFCTDIVACVTGGGTNLDAYETFNCNVGSIAAANPADVADILGDWTAPLGGDAYIKTTASGDTISLSFERFLFENVDADENGPISATSKGDTLTFEGGAGVTTSTSVGKVTFALTGVASLIQITSAALTSGTLDEETGGAADQISYRTYDAVELTMIVDGGVIKYRRSGTTGTLYDFTPTAPNEPILDSNVPATLTAQGLEIDTIIVAIGVSPGSPWPSPAWVRSGPEVFSSACNP